MKYDVFISYSRKDFEEVSALIEKVKVALPGISYWFDIDGIESGDEFEDKIISAIDNSSYVLFALSENFIGSQWTKDEVMYAKNTDKKVIPVLLRGAQMKGWFLFKFGRVDCIDSTNQLQMDKLLHNLAAWTGKPMSEHQSAPSVEEAPALAPVVRQTTTPAPKPVEKIWKVGDYYNVNGKEGVVFWVDETGKHGKIVSVDQAKLRWSSYREEDWAVEFRNLPILNQGDGMEYLQIISAQENWRNEYPAFAWCAAHGEGWYLPTVDELKMLLLDKTSYDQINTMLVSRNLVPLNPLRDEDLSYWASEREIDLGEECGYTVMPLYETSMLEFSLDRFHYVRAVANF